MQAFNMATFRQWLAGQGVKTGSINFNHRFRAQYNALVAPLVQPAGATSDASCLSKSHGIRLSMRETKEKLPMCAGEQPAPSEGGRFSCITEEEQNLESHRTASQQGVPCAMIRSAFCRP